MRSFSNIMTNFAGNLHLLVDSIKTVFPGQKAKKQVKKLCVSLKSIIFAVGRQLLPSRTARSDACQSKNFAFYNFQNL